MIKHFYMVMRDDHTNYTQKRHYLLREAQAEAERLCKKEGVRFIILKAIMYVEPKETPVIWSPVIWNDEWEIEDLAGLKNIPNIEE